MEPLLKFSLGIKNGMPLASSTSLCAAMAWRKARNAMAPISPPPSLYEIVLQLGIVLLGTRLQWSVVSSSRFQHRGECWKLLPPIWKQPLVHVLKGIDIVIV